MENEELEKWVDAYIEVYDHEEIVDEFHPCYWAVEKFADLEADAPEFCWEAMKSILAKSSSERVLTNIALGPMEELIELHGADYIGKIEKEAQTNLNFREMLRAVLETTNEEVWNRVLRARTDA